MWKIILPEQDPILSLCMINFYRKVLVIDPISSYRVVMEATMKKNPL